jgi:hypothetical protein
MIYRREISAKSLTTLGLVAYIGPCVHCAAFAFSSAFREFGMPTQTRLTSLILLDESYGGSVLQDQDLDHVVRFVPCVLKKPLTNELVHGRALRRNDGCLLAMLDLPTGDVAFEGFIQGRFVGRDEERNRTRQFFHDILSSKILVASFIAHEIYQRLAANGAEEAEELGRVTKLLRQTIHDISHGFEEPAMQAEIIPEREAESLKRLLERQANPE